MYVIDMYIVICMHIYMFFHHEERWHCFQTEAYVSSLVVPLRNEGGHLSQNVYGHHWNVLVVHRDLKSLHLLVS